MNTCEILRIIIHTSISSDVQSTNFHGNLEYVHEITLTSHDTSAATHGIVITIPYDIY